MAYVYLVYFIRTATWWERFFGIPSGKELHGVYTTEEKAYGIAAALAGSLEKGRGIEATRVERWRLD